VAPHTLFNTILPPNAVSCIASAYTNQINAGQSVLPPASFHTGGVNTIMMDGSGKFVTDAVDTGTNTATSGAANGGIRADHRRGEGKSPYGIWGAAGSINGKESAGSL
jgi:hypothetical protein